MFIYSTYLKAFFWIFMGLCYALIIASAPIWAEDLNLQMDWWKWPLAAGWYVLLSIGIAAGTTLIGEKEPRAGYYILALSVISLFVLGFILFNIL
ncbi:hypothetical protein ACFL9T_22080 [Thermodesulfobacteriota bacterium]